ncbi:MAG: hypothetical protein QXP42_03095 [Candidatus Micrarchaeia archaeon]
MWLVVSLVSALLASSAYLLLKNLRKYRIGMLALMLWGVSIMVAVDHLVAFLNGEPFIQLTTEGLVESSILLGILMLTPVFLVWAIFVCITSGKCTGSA